MSDFRRRLFLTSAVAALFAERTRAQPVPLGGDAGYQDLPAGSLYAGVLGTPPTLDLNLMSNTLDPSITWTRLNANATDGLYTDGIGATYNTFVANQPRISAANGLMIETFVTNQLLNSNAPVTQTTASLAAANYVLWVSGTGSATPTVGTAVGTGFGAPATALVPSLFTVTTAGTVVVTVSGSLTRFQLEQGLGPSSYIPTVGTTVVRQTDSGILPVGAWFNQAEGTLLVDYLCLIYLSTGWSVPSLAIDTNNLIEMRLNTFGNETDVVVSNAVVGVVGSAPPRSAGVLQRAAYTYNSATRIVGSANSGQINFTTATGAIPLFTQIKFGPLRTNPVTGFVRRIRYWPRALSATELEPLMQTGNVTSLDFDFMSPGKLNLMLTFTRTTTGTYFDNTGTMQTASANAPRWDYDTNPPVLRGLLIEDQRTNLIKNSTMVGAVAGSPGTDPTGWNVGNNTGLTKVTATGTESGIAYVEYRFSGTAVAGSINIQNSPAGTSACVVTGSTAYSHFTYVAFTAGSKTNITSIAAYQNMYDSGGVFISTQGSGAQSLTPFTVGDPLTKNRFGGTWNMAATAAFAMPMIQLIVAAGAVDFTIRVGAPQLEAGAMASSFIPTTIAGVTRATDVCSLPVGAWFNPAALSLAADFMVRQSPNPGSFSRQALALTDGSNTNRVTLIAEGVGGTASNASALTVIASAQTSTSSLGVVTANATTKLAVSLDGSKMIGALNGVAGNSIAAGIPSGLNILTIGYPYPGAVAGAGINGHVRRVRAWPVALTPNELQTNTT